ncbi:hypothetical protein GM3709_2267 [Geminocystis sp. NIES-3709]|nr:hypothetical protein GM3709_2267 [Geminocystis sp. NIES-3709]
MVLLIACASFKKCYDKRQLRSIDKLIKSEQNLLTKNLIFL